MTVYSSMISKTIKQGHSDDINVSRGSSDTRSTSGKSYMMKRIIAFYFINFTLPLALFSQSDDLKKIINDLSNKELINIKAIFSDCISKPSNCYGDSVFFKTWLDGLENETTNNLDKAADFYNKALKISRFELSTFEVMYSLGRTEILRGNTKKGIEILSGFIKKAFSELNDENSMWGFSEEGIKELKQKIENSKQLILKCQGAI